MASPASSAEPTDLAEVEELNARLAIVAMEEIKPASNGKPKRKTGSSIIQSVGSPPNLHRLLPQSKDAEQGVICSVLLSPQESLVFAAEKGVSDQWFHFPSHQTVYGALELMSAEGKPIDFISLTEWLRDRGQLPEVGGASFITDLFTFLPTAANLAHYVEVLDEKRQLREAINHCTRITGRCYEEQDNVEAVIESLEAGSLQIRAARYGTSDKEKSCKAYVIEAINSIQTLYERKGQITGISTGFKELDKLTDGLTNNRLVIIAARPSLGKTALSLNIAENVAVDGKKPVVIFSLEMSGQQLMQRLLCSRAKVNLQMIRDGFMNERDFPALQTAAGQIASAPIHIDDLSEATIQYIRAKCRRFKSKYPEGFVVVVDYLQLVSSTAKRGAENRQVEVSDISRGLKLIAKELDIPVIALAQISRRSEQEKRKPKLSDLRESGSIEQDADDVWFIERPEMSVDPDDDEAPDLSGIAELIIAKQRNGECNGMVPLTFLKQFTRFESRAHTPKEERPVREKGGKWRKPKVAGSYNGSTMFD